MMARIPIVDEASAQLAVKGATTICIVATGRTETTGWTNGRLQRLDSSETPSDRMILLEFVADPPPPGAEVVAVHSPISAALEFTVERLVDFWSAGEALMGVRVVANHNSKAVEILPKNDALALARGMSPRVVATIVEETPADSLGFERDIRPLFRPRDVNAMLVLRNLNLHSYDDVKLWAVAISERLKDDMPCDGLWPTADVEKFDAWLAGGMQP